MQGFATKYTNGHEMIRADRVIRGRTNLQLTQPMCPH